MNNILSLLPVIPSSKDFKPSENDSEVSIEWDHTSKTCVICETPWGTFLNRRHHCRHCKRLVCESCSSKRLVLDSQINGALKRVCDGCYTILTTKQNVAKQANLQRDKNENVLKSTSFISSCLLRVFFLDGSHRTTSFDSSTTIADLVQSICFSVKCAIFEVKDDINSNEQYRLINQSELIGDVFNRWNHSGMNCAKLVLPLYDIQSSSPMHKLPSLTILRQVNAPYSMEQYLSISLPPSNAAGQQQLPLVSSLYNSSSNNSPTNYNSNNSGTLDTGTSAFIGNNTNSSSNGNITNILNISNSSNNHSSIAPSSLLGSGLALGKSIIKAASMKRSQAPSTFSMDDFLSNNSNFLPHESGNDFRSDLRNSSSEYPALETIPDDVPSLRLHIKKVIDDVR